MEFVVTTVGGQARIKQLGGRDFPITKARINSLIEGQITNFYVSKSGVDGPGTYLQAFRCTPIENDEFCIEDVYDYPLEQGPVLRFMTAPKFFEFIKPRIMNGGIRSVDTKPAPNLALTQRPKPFQGVPLSRVDNYSSKLYPLDLFYAHSARELEPRTEYRNQALITELINTGVVLIQIRPLPFTNWEYDLKPMMWCGYYIQPHPEQRPYTMDEPLRGANFKQQTEHPYQELLDDFDNSDRPVILEYLLETLRLLLPRIGSISFRPLED